MKNLFFISIVIVIISMYAYADVVVLNVKGVANVRHGMQEEWTAISVGDVLKPEDSIESGKKSSITILIDGKTKIVIPELVIIDVSDLRDLTEEEFLLKLAMENVRSVPKRERRDELNIPRTTTIHGTNMRKIPASSIADMEPGIMQLNGTKILYENKYFSTCILKAKEVFRLCPKLKSRIDKRLMVADALLQVRLEREAYAEFIDISGEKLAPSERIFVEKKIEQLKIRDKLQNK